MRNEADHSPPPSAKVRNEWNSASTPPIYLHGVERESSTFSFMDGNRVLCKNKQIPNKVLGEFSIKACKYTDANCALQTTAVSSEKKVNQ
jgi:hypothetical protein